MKNLAVLSLLILPVSCVEKQEAYPTNDFTDKVINFSIGNRDDTYIELPGLYDKTKAYIPEERDENLILADRLKNRGFKLTQTGRVNQQLSGRRIVTMTLLKDDCECEVDKVYYTTANISEYIVAERIRCRGTKQ